MRALHLLGMKSADGAPLRFFGNGDAPLVIPHWFSAADTEILLAFYQQILGNKNVLPRIEVDWYHRLLPADAEFLQNQRQRHGATDYLVVVRVREPTPLAQVLSQPEVAAFQHVAITHDAPPEQESLGRLRELVQLVWETLDALYWNLAEELGYRTDGNALLRPLVRTLLNPMSVVDVYNALIDVQAEGVAKESQLAAIQRRLFDRRLTELPQATLITLSALVFRNAETWRQTAGEADTSAGFSALRARLLLRDDRLTRWAALGGEPLQEACKQALQNLRHQAAQASTLPVALDMVESWAGATVEKVQPEDPILDRVMPLFGLLNAGQLQRVADELDAVESRLFEAGVTHETRGYFWSAYGRLRMDQGDWPAAESAFRRASDLLEKGGANTSNRGNNLHQLACGLRDHGAWTQAEVVFRKALELLEQGGAPPTSLGTTMGELARGLRDHGDWAPAEAAFQTALELLEEVDDTATTRGAIMHDLARGLRVHGDWTQAEAAFRKALELKLQGGDTTTSRSNTLNQLACGLRDHGDWTQAEAVFRKALEPLEETDDTATARSAIMHEWACGLRDHRDWTQAEAVFRKALVLLEKRSASATNRGNTLHELACGLRDHGDWTQAEDTFRKALELKRQGGDAATSRGITMAEWACGLRDHGDWTQAQTAFQTAMELLEESDDTATTRGAIMSELARGLRDHGDWTQAEAVFRKALNLKEQGGDNTTSRAATMYELARGLWDHGDWTLADEAFRELILFDEAGGATPKLRALNHDAYAEGLLKNGFIKQAEEHAQAAARLRGKSAN